MAKIGTSYVPDIYVSDAVKITKTIYKNDVKTEQELANRMGHKTTNSGTFMKKMVTLRKLGLIRSGIKGVELTELGKKIAKPLSQSDGMKAQVEMLDHVPLLRDLKKKFGAKKPERNDFIASLIGITGADQIEADKEAGRMQNLFNDALQFMGDLSSDDSPDVAGDKMQMQQVEDIPSRDDVLEIKQGLTYIRIPKDIRSIQRTKKMLEIYEDELKQEGENYT